MRPKTYLFALSPLLKNSSFTSREVRSLGVRSQVLTHYVKTGQLKRIGRGLLYQSIDYENPSDTRWSDLAEAVSPIPTSALVLYDLTEELPHQHWIGIRYGTSARSNRQIKIIRFRNLELGKTKIEVEGISISIFDRERTVVDACDVNKIFLYTLLG